MFGGLNLSAAAFVSHFQGHAGPCMQGAKPFFAWYASAGSLIGAASGGVGHIGMEGGGHPLIRLFRDGSLEQELSDLCETTFGEPLTLDRIGGDIRLRVGAVRIDVPPLNRPTAEYASAVQDLPHLDQQGDGLKSFLGLALNVLAGTSQVLLIDEPEAFLHPSQAKALGRWLGREALRRDIQIILSTHDRDLLLGLLDSENAVVNVVRISRTGNVNCFHELPHEEVAVTWNDPVLRYSNILQGLFHRRVAISESDADCRFCGAVLDQLGTDQGKRAIADDVLFVPSGGKQRVAAMASALTKLGVETFAIVDFDVFRVRSDVAAIVEAMGSDWTDDMNEAYIAWSSIANQDGLWDNLKHQGVNGLPAGPANIACQRLIDVLRQLRVLVVPVGEMEDCDKSIGLHGAGWVSEMLAQNKHKSNESARALLAALVSSST